MMFVIQRQKDKLYYNSNTYKWVELDKARNFKRFSDIKSFFHNNNVIQSGLFHCEKVNGKLKYGHTLLSDVKIIGVKLQPIHDNKINKEFMDNLQNTGILKELEK